MRTPGEQQAYDEGLLAGALRTRIYAEGEFADEPSPVRAAEAKVRAMVELCQRISS